MYINVILVSYSFITISYFSLDYLQASETAIKGLKKKSCSFIIAF